MHEHIVKENQNPGAKKNWTKLRIKPGRLWMNHANFPSQKGRIYLRFKQMNLDDLDVMVGDDKEKPHFV